MAKHQKTKRKQKKTRLILVSLGCLTLAAGYHTGRATSFKWNSKETAGLYACYASHRVKNAPDGAVLALALPDAEYRYDGKKVTKIPIASADGHERYPVVGAEEYETWLNAMVTFAAAAGARTAWGVLTDSSELKGFERVLVEERIPVAAVTTGAFGGGYFLGHTFQQNLDAPLFRAALLDKDLWNGVRIRKQQLAEAKANLDETRKNLKALQAPYGAPDKQIAESEKRIDEEYATLLKMDPDLKNLKN
jgi:hypothetical protein